MMVCVVIQTHSQFDGLGVEVAGKTGTAELDLRHPNHGLFIGYAPASIRICGGNPYCQWIQLR